MKNKKIRVYFSMALLVIIASGCYKNETFYYDDPVIPGVAIFSNTGNNLLTCQLNGRAWKTVKRESGSGFSSFFRTELELRRRKTAGAWDTLTITWFGHQQNQDQFDIALTLPVAKNFEWKDIAAYSGKRLVIDSSNGFFSLNYRGSDFHFVNGKGIIYFNNAMIDSSGTGNSGGLAGLLQARFNNGINADYMLSNGRFDNNIAGILLASY